MSLAWPVTAVIYTHSHVDHYGGVMGVLTPEDIARSVPIVAPEGFLHGSEAHVSIRRPPLTGTNPPQHRL